MPYDYTLTAVIPASAREVYDAWLDSLAHSEMTGGRANMSAEIGAEFSAWDGYITGRNLQLVPGERIVQSWRTTKFPEDHEDSTITVTLEEGDAGTLLTLSHSNVPEGHLGYEQGGWQKSYFEPMIAYFSSEPLVGGDAEELAQSEPAPEVWAAKPAEQQPVRRAWMKPTAAKKTAAAPKGRPKRATRKKKAATPDARPERPAAKKKPAAKQRAGALKARRKSAAARTKSKGAAPKVKKAAARTQAKPGVRAKARAKRVGGARRKSAGGRRR